MQARSLTNKRGLAQWFGWTSGVAASNEAQGGKSIASAQRGPATPGYYFYYSEEGQSHIAHVFRAGEGFGSTGGLLVSLGGADPRTVNALGGQWDGPLSEEEVARLTNPGNSW
jgi:hypothetical protein